MAIQVESRTSRRMTSNKAEFIALKEGLKDAKAEGVKNLLVRGDSELVIDLMEGRKTPRNAHLIQLTRQVQDQRLDFHNVTFEHVRRNIYEVADELATEAICGEPDSRLYFTDW